MKDNKDLEYIRKAFEEDGLKAPESLQEDKIAQLLEDAGEPERVSVPTKPKRRWKRPAIALAACAVLAIGLIPAIQSARTVDPQDLIAEDAGMYGFKSESQLDRKMKELIGEDQSGVYMMNEDVDTAKGSEGDQVILDESAPMAAAENATADGAAAPSASPAERHSETYTQVEGIDEADMVKTDGKYIYFISEMENQVIIASAKDGKASRVSAINIGDGTYVLDLYITGDRLIIIGSDDVTKVTAVSGQTWKEITKVSVYDISDRKAPKEETTYSQTGSLLSSRLIGNQLVLVTNDRIWNYVKNKNIPYVCYDGEFRPLPVEDICCFEQPVDPSYTVIGLLDVTTGTASKDSVKTQAVLGSSNNIYCNGKHLYIAATAYSGGKHLNKIGISPADGGKPATQILKVSLEGGNVKHLASAVVDGTLNNQFSMDESNGYFKVATTTWRKDKEVNDLYVFNENMKEIGSVRNFARDEHIEAVRYVKNKAYVITYRQTDPLFIIDLSDPEKPYIEGHVKISGFSTLLVPEDNDHLLGLGFGTENTEFGEATDGVKLVIFDVSDPSHPKVADSKAFKGMGSPVQYDHKALLVDPEGNYYAIPYDRWTESSEDDGNLENGVLVFSADNGSLKVLQDHKLKDEVRRCITIGDYIYGICSDDNIEGFFVK